jgi:type VI secretion system secreted protein VgrG
MPIQAHRLIGISTILGEEDLAFYQGRISEELSRPFEIRAELISDIDNIAIEDLLATNATIRCQLPDDDYVRYFNGIFTEVEQLPTQDGFSRYQTTLRPWFWLLTLAENCRIFQNKSYLDIIKDVFEASAFTDYEFQCSATYAKLDYVVQFNETDFNFVSRLMEEQGIFYYFQHENGRHVMVLHDDSHILEESTTLNYFVPDLHNTIVPENSVSSWQTKKVARSAAAKLDDFDYLAPSKNLFCQTENPTTASLKSLARYRYPGKYDQRDQGSLQSRLLQERENSFFETRICHSNTNQTFVGTLFTLKDFYNDSENQQYLAVASEVALDADSYTSSHSPYAADLYRCMLQAIPGKATFRPQSSAVKPKMTGPQTAIVVGKEGEEIWTDKYGRIKVKFHWDQSDRNNETASCWIRVAQSWAGKSWGTLYIPRIGQEVIIDFIDGDPDKPIVIGCVYNGSNTPPYNLPGEALQSGIKTMSSKGGNGFNELMFNDSKGKEQIFMHAERNRDVRVKNDDLEFIGHDQHQKVKNDRFSAVDNNDHLLIGNDAIRQIKGDLHCTVDGDLNQKTDGSESYTINGDRKTKIGSSENLKASSDIKLEAGMNFGLKTGMQVDIKSGITLNLEAGVTINLKAGSSFISIGPAGVQISGPMVMINSGGSAAAASPAAPAQPARATLPTKAKEARKSEAGKALTTTPKKKPVKPASYGSQAKVMKYAAESGTPFCEQCEAGKK